MTDSTAEDNEALMQRVRDDLIDSYDEELEMEIEDREHLPPATAASLDRRRGAGSSSPLFPRTVPPARRTGQAAGLGGQTRARRW